MLKPQFKDRAAGRMSRRDLIVAGATTAGIFSLGAKAKSWPPDKASGSRPPVSSQDSLWFVDPELRPSARQAREMFESIIPVSSSNLAQARLSAGKIGRDPSPAMPWRKQAIAVGRGAPDVTIYVINAKPGANLPGVLHCHGGGYVLGSAAASIRRLQDFAATLGCVVVSVEYRLAPETRWQGSIEDNYAGLRWLHDHAEELGVDIARLAVMGESAGGGHAARLAITARDRGEIALAFQCLQAPMLDDRTGSTRQLPPHMGALVWDAASNRFGWRSFLGQEPGSATVPAAAVPARVADLSGLPPAWIGVGSIDLFASEDMEYARRLVEAGVPTELFVVAGAYHGFYAIAADTGPAQAFAARQFAALRRALSA